MTVPRDLVVLSGASATVCRAAAATLRRAAGMATVAEHRGGHHFFRIGASVDVRNVDGSAVVAAILPHPDHDPAMGTMTEEVVVGLHPLSLGLARHPWTPREPAPLDRIAAEEAVEGTVALALRAAALLDEASDPRRAPPPGLVRELRRRIAGVAATLVAERADEIPPDVVWTSHDGPLRVMASDKGGRLVDVLDDDRRTRWSAGLPPIMVVERARTGPGLSIRPLVLDAAETPASIVERIRLAGGLAGL